MSEYVDPFANEEPNENRETRMPKDELGPIIKVPEDVPAALERVSRKEPDSFYWDRMKTDREWLARRAGKKK